MIFLWLLSGGGGYITGRIPRALEAFLAWNLAVYCLTVPFWVKIRSSVARCMAIFSSSSSSFQYIPLVTTSYAEKKFVSTENRYDQLVSRLLEVSKVNDVNDISDDKLVEIIRSDEICRRLATLTMRAEIVPYRQVDRFQRFLASKWAPLPFVVMMTSHLKSEIGHLPALVLLVFFVLSFSQMKNGRFERRLLDTHNQPKFQLCQRLAQCWPSLLPLPPIGTCKSDALNSETTISPTFIYRHSLIVPAYRESGRKLADHLNKAKSSCSNPNEVEVIVVDAGENENLQEIFKHRENWGSFLVIDFRNGGGRGYAQNEGGMCAKGLFLTFLHSDTILPFAWDSKIANCLYKQGTAMCAFSFGIDKSNGRMPPGLRAVEITANLRSNMYSLPYGDQVLSVPNTAFRYLGGFPYQCLFEDYELVSLVRMRAQLVKQVEKLVIIGGEPSRCSPRRWLKLGVLRVTYTNSYLVNLYASGMSPEKVFEKYYGSIQRASRSSPWESKIKK